MANVKNGKMDCFARDFAMDSCESRAVTEDFSLVSAMVGQRNQALYGDRIWLLYNAHDLA